MKTQIKQLNESALLVIGHGSSDFIESTDSINKHSRAIADKSVVKEVHSGFIKTHPFMDVKLQSIESRFIYIVPCFAMPGNLTKSVIPEQLKLTGTITKRNNQTIYYCEPVGNHPLIAKRQSELLKNTLEYTNMSLKDTTIIVISHGSSKYSESEFYTQSVVEFLKKYQSTGQIIPLFLDQSPNLADWKMYSNKENIIFLTHLFSWGRHEAVDVPMYIGLKKPILKERLTSNSPIGPINIAEKKIWFCPAISSDNIIQEVIIQRVLEATGL